MNSGRPAPPVELRVSNPPFLDDEDASAVVALTRSGPGADRSPPLSESALLHLQHSEPTQHAVVTDPNGTVRGYAQLVATDSDSTIELVTAVAEPMATAKILLTSVLASADPHRPVLLWAHGTASAAAALAAEQGWKVHRRLLQMRRPLAKTTQYAEDGQQAQEAQGAGLVIRTFNPESDTKEVLALNARAFAHHPEQGGWKQSDLIARTSSSWFDPAGFLVAELEGRLVGFHWTKVHSESEPPVGEVYVLGVDPAAQGQRVGQHLLTAGLAHLRRRGLSSVLLYVESDNLPAVALYEKQGFDVFATDTQHELPRRDVLAPN